MAFKVPAVNTYERNFGHCIVLWKIKNFSLAACESGTEIRTSEFTVSSLKLTRWQIGFRIESECRNLQLFLKRLDDETDDSFRVTWKITILNWKGEGTFVSEKKSFIHKGSEFRVDSISPLEILKALPAEESDEVKMKFQMIVLMNTSSKIPTPSDDELKSLSEDLAVIGKEGLYSDLNILLNGKIMKGHKAVLCPRSKRLSQAAGYQSKNIQLYLSDTEAINCVCAYLYTGDLKFIFDPPSISVYDYIVHLDIKELRDSYPQERITLETVIEATKREFQWAIQDFPDCDGPQDSEIYGGDGKGTKWQLRIYPKGRTGGTEIQKKYVYIEALALNCQQSQNVYVDFVTRNDKGLITVAKRTHGRIKSGEKLGVLFMRIGGSLMAKSLVGTMLNISFSVHTATGKSNSTIIETLPPVPFNLTNFDTYGILTNYMGLLQSDNEYSDVTLIVHDQEFKAHKFLLAGRSVTFSQMVRGMKDDSTSLPINTLNKHVFRVFLDYLYRAVLTDIDVAVLVHLYDVALHFMVKNLEKLCIKHITGQINPASSCFLLLFAHERHLTTLKTEVMNYISAYREHIIDNKGWRKIEEKNPQLFYDVVCFLGNQPAKHSVYDRNGQQKGS